MSLKEIDFDPVQLTEEVVRTYAANAEAKGLQLYAMLDADVLRHVHGDASKMKQVLNNLLSNAIKFSDAGWVRVTLAAATGDAGEPLLRWQVSDTGIGVSEAQITSLFQPFYQVQDVHNTIPGTGLGLYICHSLCEMMRGRIQVESSPGRGSTFRVEVPTVPARTAQVVVPTATLKDAMVWVRAPIGELAQNVAVWLKRAGARVRAANGQVPEDSGTIVLLELFPDRMPPIGWNGPRVSCTPAGPDLPQRGVSGVQVNAHVVDSIVLAVAAAQLAKTGYDDTVSYGAGGALGILQPATAPNSLATYRPAMGLERLGLRVLVVEDNEVNRALLARQLEELGCAVSTCADGLEVLDRWGMESFDVLLTDMNMPNLDGYELVRLLRQRGITIPIVGITASAMSSERELGLAMGLDAWVTKPIDLPTLYDVLRRACAGVGNVPRVMARPWLSGDEFAAHLKGLFKESMQKDLPLAWEALSNRDVDLVLAVLHRMRGALAVMKVEEVAMFTQVLEARLSADGLTPALDTAVRSMLREIESTVEQLQ